MTPSAVPVDRQPQRIGGTVLGVHVDRTGWDELLTTIWRWARVGQSRVVCCCNAHSVVAARHDRGVRAALAAADRVTPDGMPVAWMLRRLGHAGQQRVDGPDLMWRLCGLAARAGLPIFLYGNRPATLSRLEARLRRAFPDLVVAGTLAPPFAPALEAVALTGDVAFAASRDAERTMVERINHSGARLVFVSLGCPKQELWMARQRGAVRAVMVGVGAAFDFHAGTLRRAPAWMRACGLEWLHRLACEPRRLWRRYASTNSRFLAGALVQLTTRWRARRRGKALAEVGAGAGDALIE